MNTFNFIFSGLLLFIPIFLLVKSSAWLQNRSKHEQKISRIEHATMDVVAFLPSVVAYQAKVTSRKF